jgi:hypothetical protein
VKHAGSAALDQLSPLLERLRAFPAMKERSRGVFYRAGRAFLHFHEDPAGLFADIRDESGKDFDRIKVDDEAGSAALMTLVEARLSWPR